MKKPFKMKPDKGVQFSGSIVSSSGVMVEADKSLLTIELEKGATNAEQIPRPFVVVIDGVAMACKVRNKGLNIDD